MNKKELKRLMTDVAKGKISKKEADDLLKEEKVAKNSPIKQKKVSHTRKRTIKTKEVK